MGIPVLVYTVNDTRRGGVAEHLAELGVAGVFTDDPAAMSQLFVLCAAESRETSVPAGERLAGRLEDRPHFLP